jgi:hypothetical protein
LVVPLYSLRTHCVQPGCGFIGASGVGILVYFPSFVLTVGTSKDCHLAFESLGRSALLDTLHYVQPRCAPTLYPSELTSHTASKSPTLPALVKVNSSVPMGDVNQDNHDNPPLTLAPPLPPSLPSQVNRQPPSATLESVSAKLKSLAESILCHPPTSPPTGISLPPKLRSSPTLASTMTMTRDEIISLVH